MQKYIIVFIGIIMCMSAYAAGPQLILDGGYVVNAYWNGKYAVQTDYSDANPTGPEQVGYTVYMQLECKLTRMSDGMVSRSYNPLLGIAGDCDLVNDKECTVDVALARAHTLWENNADFICWQYLKENWTPEKASLVY